MLDVLTSLIKKKRIAEKKVTDSNKEKIRKEINSYMPDNGYGKLPKKATVKEVERMKKQYLEQITNDIVNIAVQDGKHIVAEIEGRDLKKSEDYETRRFGEFAKDLAKAKYESSKNLTKEEKDFLERGNSNIKGYGNEDMITLFEKTKNKKDVQALINEVKNQDPKRIYYDKQKETLDLVFTKVEVFRENDIKKVKDKIDNLNMEEALNHYNYLLETLDTYGSPTNIIGKWDGDETELANARLDDIMIRMGLKDSGINKVNKAYKQHKKISAEIKKEEEERKSEEDKNNKNKN